MLSPFLQKLLFVRQFNIDEGVVDLLGVRYVMLDATLLLALQDMDETKMYGFIKSTAQKNINSIVEHAKVYKNIKDESLLAIVELGKKISNSDQGMIKALQDLFNVSGLGKMEIQDLDNKGKTAKVIIKGSVIADEWKKKTKKGSKEPVCTLTAGFLAGMFSYIFKKDVNCEEVKCFAKGDDSCLFQVS